MKRLLSCFVTMLLAISPGFAKTTGPIQRYLTAKDNGDRLAEKKPIAVQAESSGDDAKLPSVFIDPSKRYQTIEGFGGAFTEAAAVTLRKMSPANQRLIMKAYFDPKEGNAYSLCRTHINSCDFALGNYAYADVPGDTELKHFSIARDEKALLPMIKEAFGMSKTTIKLFASPWSPPGWMKTNGMMNKGGKLKPEYREAWANYYVRYIQEYKKQGVDIWAITVQNEPAAVQSWDSCEYSAEEERDFVRDHLGPAMQKAGLGDVKIIIWDHNQDLLVQRAAVAYADPEASKYIWGTGFHWYSDEKFDNLSLHHDTWPDKKLLFTEGCQEGGPHLGEWKIGERYGRAMINDLNRWTVGWTDWNLLLDETGGPNHVNNLCSAPIIADTKNDKVLFQSSYYYIGHFSRFVHPGARRILCSTPKETMEAAAFVNPDGSVAVIVMNRTEKAMRFQLNTPDSTAVSDAPAHSIATYLYPAEK